jgi:glycosyltransferase involved in cell wall biosynthesis
MKRVLVCAPGMPEFDREGGSRRIFHLLEFLQEDGLAVSYLARNGGNNRYYPDILRQRGIATYAGQESMWAGDEYLPDIVPLLKAARFDLIIFAFWYIAEQYMPLVRLHSPGTKVVVDSIDLHFLRAAREVLGQADGQVRRAIDAPLAMEMMRELTTYAAADGVLAVSEKEAGLVNDFTNNSSLAYSVPLMEDLPPSVIPVDQRRGILFIGNFRHPPNVEALEFLFQKIVPHLDRRILERHPVYVVGNGLSSDLATRINGLENVHLVGWVPSVVPYLHSARLTVVPLLSGAGTKTKLIQALTVGTPTVSTTIGVEGLNLTRGHDVLVADDPEVFAQEIDRLCGDNELWLKLSSRGRESITLAHGRLAVKSRFTQALASVFAVNPSGTQDAASR